MPTYLEYRRQLPPILTPAPQRPQPPPDWLQLLAWAFLAAVGLTCLGVLCG